MAEAEEPELENVLNYGDGSSRPNTVGGSSYGTPSRPLSPVRDIQHMATQILEAGGVTGSELPGIPAQELGAALANLIAFDMSTQADVDSTKLQHMMKFMLGAVNTLATEQQTVKAESKRLAAEHAAMLEKVAEADKAAADAAAAAAGSGMPDWAAKLREDILAAAAADAKAAAEAGGLSQVQDLQAMIDQLLEARRAQDAEMAKLQADMQQLSGAVASASGDPAAMQAAMADAEARSRAAAEAGREAREKEDAERQALKDEIASVEEELRRIMAMQTQMQQQAAGVAGPVTGAVDADQLAAAVERANAENTAAIAAMREQAEKDTARFAQLAEKIASLEKLLHAMAAGGGGDGDGGAAASAMMSQFTDALDELRKALEGKAGLEAMQQLQEELNDEMRAAINKVEALSAADAEAAEKQRKLAMAAMEGAGAGAGGDVSPEAMQQMQNELAALMGSKPDWAEIEAALAKKSDLDAVLKKADASYVDELFKSLRSSMENQLYDLQKDAKEGKAGAAEELEKLEDGWRELQERLLEKADRDDLEELEKRLMAGQNQKRGAGGHGGKQGMGGGKGAKSGARRSGTGSFGGRSGTGGALNAESEEERPKELTPEERAAELARLQSLLEQRLANLQSINEHRGWGVRDEHVREFVQTPLPDGLGDAAEWVNASAGTVGIDASADQTVDSSAHPFMMSSEPSDANGSAMLVPPNNKTLTQLDAVGALRVDAGFDLKGERLSSNRRFTFDVYTWGDKRTYKPKPKHDEATAEPTDRDLQLLMPPHPLHMTRSFHGGSGQYMLDRSLRAGDHSPGQTFGSMGTSMMSQSAGDVLGMEGIDPLDGELGMTGSTAISAVNSEEAHAHAMADGAPLVPVAQSISQPAGIGLATTIRDPASASRAAHSIRAVNSRRSPRGESPQLAPWADAMPMPLPSALKVRVGGGMVNRRKMQQVSGDLSASMSGSAATQRAMSGSSLSAKNRVHKTLRPVGRAR